MKCVQLSRCDSHFAAHFVPMSESKKEGTWLISNQVPCKQLIARGNPNFLTHF